MVAAIGSAAHAREKVHAPAAQVADDELGLYQYFSTIVPARYCARESSPPADMQQASAAYSNVEAEVLALQVALKNRMAEPSVERDSDSEQASHSPCSSYGGDCLDENWHAAFDGGMDATCQLYDAANVHYTRQQGVEHRPAVRWQSDFHQARSAQARHSPQHAILAPNKSCLKQRPEGFTLWFCDVKPEHITNELGFRTSVKSIDGKKGHSVSSSRKRSRLSLFD
ncbi:hypothetical protein WJX79_001360 [Trebouxia sp. C0005]|nr:MAG: hypothetical protein FRX49_04453 [Trebouxia sp. A1-2]